MVCHTCSILSTSHSDVSLLGMVVCTSTEAHVLASFWLIGGENTCTDMFNVTRTIAPSLSTNQHQHDSTTELSYCRYFCRHEINATCAMARQATAQAITALVQLEQTRKFTRRQKSTPKLVIHGLPCSALLCSTLLLIANYMTVDCDTVFDRLPAMMPCLHSVVVRQL